MSLNSEAGRDADKHGETSRLFPVAVTGYSNGRTGGTGHLHDVEQPPSRSDFVDYGDRGLDSANDMRKAAAFGALDGVLLSFAVVAGAAGGGLSTSTVLIVGVSCIVAEALSMGLGEFLSSKAMNEYMALQRKRGEWQLGHNREEEIVSMVNSYILQGMSREDAEEVASRLSKYGSCFVNAKMANEFGSYASPVDDDDSLREGLVSFLSFTLSGCIPLLVYALSPVMEYVYGGEAISDGTLFLLASLVTMVSLFFIGIIKASFVSRSWWNAAMETLVLGGCSAGLSYEIGAAMAILVKGMQ